jgi:hypothetical protein
MNMSMSTWKNMKYSLSYQKNISQIVFATSIEYFLIWKNLLSHGICTYNCLFVIEQQFSNLAMDVNMDVGGNGC